MILTLQKINKITLLVVAIIAISYSLNAQVNRTISGHGNNQSHQEWGAVGTNQLHVGTIGFGDGISIPAGETRPNPRDISNLIFAQNDLLPDAMELSDYAWAWGQFIDHNITLVGDHADEEMDIPVPMGDVWFDPLNTGSVVINMHRSNYDTESGTSVVNPRSFPNGITSFIDGSGVYGSTNERAIWLRSFDGGKLRMSAGDFLPYNTLDGELDSEIDISSPEMAMPFPHVTKLFVAGDVRANENPLLTAIHTMFAREHNRLCDELAIENPEWGDEQLYQHARKIVGGIIQAVVYEEWLPTMGVHFDAYSGYDDKVDPGIMNVFSAAAYRYGHSVINSELVRMDNDGFIIPQGNILLRDAFFNPQALVDGGGLPPVLKGMATQIEQDFDCKVIDDLRNFLFGPPGAGGLDLASININRGRDRGLSDYNTVRADFGLPRVEGFNEMSGNPWLDQILEQTYQDVDNIDPWVGMLAEDHMSNALFGETAMAIMIEQFKALRDGDRFYYENDVTLSIDEIDDIKNTRLVDVILRNTETKHLQLNVFLAEPHETSSIADIEDHPFELRALPNPVQTNLTIQAVHSSWAEGELSITDQLGRKIYQQVVSLSPGVNNINVPVINEFAAGLYNARLIAQDKSDVVIIVKVE